jgi:hypothetical protein
LADLVAEEPLHRILFRPELVAETIEAEEGNVNRHAFDCPTFPRDPDIEIQEAWGVRQGGYDLALHRNRVLADLSIRSLAEDYNIVEAFLQRWLELVVAIKPKLLLIDEVEAAPVDNGVFLEMIFGSEENGGGKDSLEDCLHAPVLGAVLTKSKVVEELGGTFEPDDAVSLSQG